MIKNVKLALIILGVVVFSGSALAQAQPGQAQPGQAAQPEEPQAAESGKRVQVTQAEADSLTAIQNEQDPQKKIAAADAFVIAYPESQLLPYILTFAAEANQQLGQSPKAVIYYEKVLTADPQNYNAMLNIAQETANATGKFDLDKEAKLSRATDLAKQAMELIPVAEKVNPELSDSDWEDVKASNMARAHEALAMVEVAEQNYADAIPEFQTALDGSPYPNPGTMIRLGNALNEAGRPDEAIKLLNQVIGMQGLPAVYVDVAKQEKTRSEQIKKKAASGK